MKRLLLTLALALTGVVATPGPAAGAETLHLTFKGRSALAFFSSVDASGCVVTNVSVFADDGRVKRTDDPNVAESATAVTIFQENVCTGAVLLFADGFAALGADDFQIDKDLMAATLNTTIELSDLLSGKSFPVNISMAWTGEGPAFRGKAHSQFNRPGLKYIFRSDSTFRMATASGTVSDGTTDFTPQAPSLAEMIFTNQGEVVIIHD